MVCLGYNLRGLGKLNMRQHRQRWSEHQQAIPYAIGAILRPTTLKERKSLALQPLGDCQDASTAGIFSWLTLFLFTRHSQSNCRTSAAGRDDNRCLHSNSSAMLNHCHPIAEPYSSRSPRGNAVSDTIHFQTIQKEKACQRKPKSRSSLSKMDSSTSRSRAPLALGCTS